MTEMVNGEVPVQQSTSVPVNTSSTPVQTTSDERSFKQSEVNEIVGRAKQEAIERFKRDGSMQSHSNSQSYGQHYSTDQNFTNSSQAQTQQNPQFDPRQAVAEEFQRLRDEYIAESDRNTQQQEAQKIAKEFLTKIEAGKSKYDDFEKTVTDVGFGNFPYIVQLANMVDNTDDVVYELAKNPIKIANIQSLVDIAIRNGTSPTLALNEMKRLADSIKQNQNAQNFKSPNNPLSQLKPGNAGTDNKGALSVRDFKSKYRV